MRSPPATHHNSVIMGAERVSAPHDMPEWNSTAREGHLIALFALLMTLSSRSRVATIPGATDAGRRGA